MDILLFSLEVGIFESGAGSNLKGAGADWFEILVPEPELEATPFFVRLWLPEPKFQILTCITKEVFIEK